MNNLKQQLLTLLFVAAGLMSFSQVGIGTTTPVGAFHVDAAKDNVATPTNAQIANDLVVLADGNIGVGLHSPAVKLDVNGYIKVGSSDPTGDVSPVDGMIRFNTGTTKFQGYSNGAWVDLH